MFCESCYTETPGIEFIKLDGCPKCGSKLSVVDAVAKVYANFYLANPSINTNSQENRDFQTVMSLCLEAIDSKIKFWSSGGTGSGAWWRDLYQEMGKQPPEELKEYFSWLNMDWETK